MKLNMNDSNSKTIDFPNRMSSGARGKFTRAFPTLLTREEKAGLVRCNGKGKI